VPTAGIQALDPSVGAMLYQCQVLRDTLRGLTSPKYPAEAVRIATVLDLLAERAEQRLVALMERSSAQRQADPYRSRQLARIVHELYAYVRYLQAADPISSPPGVQTAFSMLVDAHVPPAVGCEKEDIVALVRPQWEYNAKLVDLTGRLEARIDIADLDENAAVFGDGGDDMASFITERWGARHRDQKDAPKSPKRMAVLSFAGLDRDDVLLYPLLAHEVGHLIDFAYPDTVSTNQRLDLHAGLPTNDELNTVLTKAGVPEELPLFRLQELARTRQRVNRLVENCLRELTADLLAVRMIGLPYFIALAEFLKTIEALDATMVVPGSGYPGAWFRLKIVFAELTGNDLRIEDGLCRVFGATPPEKVLAYLKQWREHLERDSPAATESPDLDATLAKLAAACVSKAVPKLVTLVREIIPTDRCASPSPELSHMVEMLRERLPPFPHDGPPASAAEAGAVPFADVLSAGWVYQLEAGEALELSHHDPAAQHVEYQNTCALLFKALELEIFRATLGRAEVSPDSRPAVPAAAGAGVWSGPQIKAALAREPLNRRLVIVPHPGPTAVQSASLDVHLGSWFKVARRTNHASFDVADAREREAFLREAQEEVHVRLGEKIVLHPGSFALGVTLEYVSLPGDLMAFVEGKSRLGRAGLIIATAAQVAPGFKGCVVLELVNSGTVPLVLRPGMPVAQLVFHSIDRALPPEWLYRGSFHCQVKP